MTAKSVPPAVNPVGVQGRVWEEGVVARWWVMMSNKVS